MLTIVTLVVGGIFMIQDKLTPGQYMAFSSMTWMLANPLSMLGNLLADFQRFSVAAKQILDIVESKCSIEDRPGAIELKDRARGEVEFRHVNFDIDGRRILSDINFKIGAGDTIGILGSTGSGKTSLINMLLRFFEPTEGEVLLDGVNIQKYTLSSLRRQVGLAMQEVFLFSDSVRNNIAYGRPDLPLDDVAKYAAQANAQFVSKLEDGYETLVGERGVGLSGGQKQRIALARALAIYPAILILDDTTSAVDSETETYIQDQLAHLDNPCTKIIIAQRITSFRSAKFILVMEDGKITEMGTHKDLVNNGGFYQKIYDLQIGK
jgi:ATP-binding cassette subfamily B protein